MQAICQACQQIIEIPDLPEPTIINTPDVSLVMVVHPQRGHCPHCLKPVAAGICGAAKLAVMAIPFDPPPEKSRIVAPNGNVVRMN